MKTHFTRHAWSRILGRLSLSPSDVAQLLDRNIAVDVGVEPGSNRQHRVFFSEPELHLGGNVVVPNIAGWRRERLPALPETAYFDLPPDWICEVISDSTEHYDKNAKRKIYGEAGVLFLWLLDPRGRLLEVFQLAAGKWLLFQTITGSDEVRAIPFEATPFPLGQLWPLDQPDAS